MALHQVSNGMFRKYILVIHFRYSRAQYIIPSWNTAEWCMRVTRKRQDIQYCTVAIIHHQ
jgi:hypothetical protein